MPLLTEFRVPVPLSVTEFNRAWCYMVMEAQLEMTSNSDANDEGIVVLKNEPFDNTSGQLGEISEISGRPIPKIKGQYTLKEYRLASRFPAFARAMLPAKALVLIEEAFNGYPTCQTTLTNGYISNNKFFISIRTSFQAGNCNIENALNLNEQELKARTIINLDLSQQNKEGEDYQTSTDPSLFHSKTTGRGPLQPTKWMDTADPIMTAYKVCEICCDAAWPFNGKAERTISSKQEESFLTQHARVFCSIDQWHYLSMLDIRILEDLTTKVLAEISIQRKMEIENGESESDDNAKVKEEVKKDDDDGNGNYLFLQVLEEFRQGKEKSKEGTSSNVNGETKSEETVAVDDIELIAPSKVTVGPANSETSATSVLAKGTCTTPEPPKVRVHISDSPVDEDGQKTLSV